VAAKPLGLRWPEWQPVRREFGPRQRDDHNLGEYFCQALKNPYPVLAHIL